MPSNITDDEVLYCTNVLEQFARQHELVIHDVPRDGNCLFSSVAYQLQNVGHDVNASTLRHMVVNYLSDNSEYYSQLVHQPVASNDEYDADNEALDDENAYINAIVDPELQRSLRWEKHLRRLSQGAWGDSICIAAMCNLFDVSIKVLCASTTGTSIANNDHISGVNRHVLSIGLIMLVFLQ